MDKSYNPFYTSENDLSTRSLNVIDKLGGVEQMLQHYKTFNSFQNIEKSGALVNKELSSYCQYLLHKEKQLKPEDLELIPNEEFELIIHVYINESKFLNNRTKNVLAKIEHLDRFNESFENKIKFIKKYFLEKFNFKEIGGVGSKGIRDLEDFREVVLNYKSLYENTKHKEQVIPNTILDNLYQFFEMKYPKNELASLVDEDSYNFHRVLIILFSFSFNKTQSKIYWQYYFVQGPISFTQIAKNMVCSKELVRSYIKNFESKILNELCSSIKFKLGVNYYDIPRVDSSTFIGLSNFESFNFYGKIYTPNLEFTSLVYQCLLGEDYISFNQLIEETVVLNKSFELKEQNLFIAKTFIKNYHINELLNFLNEEIYNFEITEFEYDLEMLISRFYIENKIEIRKTIIISIHEELIQKVKKDDWDLSSTVIKKQKKQEYYNKVINLTFDFLKMCDSAQKTKSLVENLAQNQIIIDKIELLRFLNGQTSTFMRFGNGLWGLTEWQVELNLKGSIREIVEDILEVKDIPVHISELLETINKVRPITRHSLDTNLRADEHNAFKFFNCAYIGLNKKNYDDYWYQIPKFSSLHIIKGSIRKQNFKTLFDEIDFISKKFGYPKQHLEFIFSEKLKSDNKN